MKLFVTDYDGTLYKDNSLEENIIMLKKLQKMNIKILISTGRSYPSIKNQVNIHNIPYDFLSCADGSIIYDKEGNILTMYKMDDTIIKPFQDFYSKIKYEEIQFVYKEGYSNILNNNSELLGINVCIANENYTKNIVDSFLEMKAAYSTYNFLNYMHPNFSYLCIKPIGITKASTVHYLVKKFEIDKKDIYVIGDSYNDYELIKEFNGACMKDSCDEILKICNNKYSNVSDYIKKIIKED